MATRAERAAETLRILGESYPEAHCELNYQTPFELLVATILSAQCTDKRVNMVTAELFRHCSTPGDFASIPQDNLEERIRSTGFFRSKAKNIRAAARTIVENHGGKVPQTMEELSALAGVGRKTANVVLGNAFGINAGVVVDTHVGRLSRRLGLSRHDDPAKVERDLMKVVPKNLWTIFSHWLIWHGRRRCTARNPDCAHCELAGICPSAGKENGKKNAGGKSVSAGP